MGKALIIKSADFSAVSFDNINVILPDGYKRVSRIFNTNLTDSEGDGVKRYFNTGIYVTPEYSIRYCGAFTTTTYPWISFFQDYVNEQTIVTRIIRNQTNNQTLMFYIATLPSSGGITVYPTVNTSLPNVYEIKGKTRSLFINDVLAATQTQAPSTLPKTTTIKINMVEVAICGDFIIKDNNDTIVFYGVPCVRESDDYAGIYDIVSDRFISNSVKNEYIE